MLLVAAFYQTAASLEKSVVSGVRSKVFSFPLCQAFTLLVIEDTVCFSG